MLWSCHDDNTEMGSRRIILLLASAAAVFVVSTSAAPATPLPGPITRLRVVSRSALRPGVFFTHYRASVRGYSRAQEIYRISWAIGDTHVKLGSALLGTYHPAQETVDVHPVSSLGAPAGLLAAINGDYSAYTTRSAYRNSGMLVMNRRIYNFGWGGPGVGYLPAGDFEIGRPRAQPVKLKLPNRLTATIGAFGALPAASDQVGAYDTGGTVVTVPLGYVAYTIDSTAFRTMLRGDRTLTNRTGRDRPEPVAAFAFAEPSAAATTTSLPIAGTQQAGAQVTVPENGAVLVAKVGGIAEVGLSALAASASPVVDVNGDAKGWGSVSAVMGGKPELVSSGVAISSRPTSIDSWQWTCGGGCWRPALIRTNSGRGSLILIGARGGSGLTMLTFARVLRQLGAQEAIGFDSNGSAEMYRPRVRPYTAYGYERWLPTATTLRYR
jgi:hypothetical protein